MLRVASVAHGLGMQTFSLAVVSTWLHLFSPVAGSAPGDNDVFLVVLAREEYGVDEEENADSFSLATLKRK